MQKSFQPTKKATIGLLVMLPVLLGLGFWQIDRLAWKTRLIEGIETQLASPAEPMPEEFTKDMQYRRVSLAGAYVAGQEFEIRPRTREGVSGYHLIQPFRRVSGGIVLVNRGFVPDNAKPDPVAAGIQRIEGVLVRPQSGRFTPENQPTRGQWYWIDVAAMAKAAGLSALDENLSPYVLQQSAATLKDRYPQALPEKPEIRNNHKQYAIFWFTMAGILLVIYVLSQTRKPQENG